MQFLQGFPPTLSTPSLGPLWGLSGASLGPLYPFSTPNYQFSTLNYQLSIINSQLPTIIPVATTSLASLS